MLLAGEYPDFNSQFIVCLQNDSFQFRCEFN